MKLINWVSISIKKLDELKRMDPMRPTLLWAKRIRYFAPVSPQIFIITLWKDSRSKWEQEGARKRGSAKKEHERHFMNLSSSDLCKAKQMKGEQRKVKVYTVSCHGGQLKAHRRDGAHAHPLLIPQSLSPRLRASIPSLVFISASVMRTKESTHSFSPPSLVLFRLLSFSVSSGKTCRPDQQL